MSKKCPFQSIIHVREARCVILIDLKPEEVKKHCTMGISSLFCPWFKRENNCPLMQQMTIWWSKEVK